MLTMAVIGLSAPSFDGERLYWLEARADQGGRTSLWRESRSAVPEEVTPAPWNVRSRVNEYGGGEYAVADGVVVFSDVRDGRLYRIENAEEPQPITPALPLRFADIRLHPDRDLLLAVREDHRGNGEPETTLVALRPGGDNPDGGQVLLKGADFYAGPELADDGRLAWTEWNHPHMPWDESALFVGHLVGRPGESRVEQIECVAGGPGAAAVRPRWAPDGRLIFVSEQTGWWNLYAWSANDGVQALCPQARDFSNAPWRLRNRPFELLGSDRLVSKRIVDGVETVALLDLASGGLDTLTSESLAYEALAVAGERVVAVLGAPDRPTRLASCSPADGTWRTVRASRDELLDAHWISTARAVSWDSDLGPVHGWYYPPTNPEAAAPTGEQPPLIVLSHGGPTGMTSNNLSMEYQFWTSRGFAILDVNYGGSSGYGRAYRDRLQGRWGIVDAADCISGALAMAERGLADRDRLVISGGSAGGFTTLRVLTTSDVFAAGVSSFGVADLEALAQDTHKFESRYLDGLVGQYPEAQQTYRERSPIQHVDRLRAPLLLLQGADDAVVPLSQAELMAQAVRDKGLPVALIVFKGEGHGFRRAENIQTAARAQLYFLGRVLGFTPADDLPAIPIDNLATSG
jgi:dipeptidyl aminopeptidase/acylaminoacyl peptidase